jgi:hypothetical protein
MPFEDRGRRADAMNASDSRKQQQRDGGESHHVDSHNWLSSCPSLSERWIMFSQLQWLWRSFLLSRDQGRQTFERLKDSEGLE